MILMKPNCNLCAFEQSSCRCEETACTKFQPNFKRRFPEPIKPKRQIKQRKQKPNDDYLIVKCVFLLGIGFVFLLLAMRII